MSAIFQILSSLLSRIDHDRLVSQTLNHCLAKSSIHCLSCCICRIVNCVGHRFLEVVKALSHCICLCYQVSYALAVCVALLLFFFLCSLVLFYFSEHFLTEIFFLFCHYSQNLLVKIYIYMQLFKRFVPIC